MTEVLTVLPANYKTHIYYRSTTTPNDFAGGTKLSADGPLTNSQIDGNFASLQYVLENALPEIEAKAKKVDEALTNPTITNCTIKGAVNIGTDASTASAVTISKGAATGSTLTINTPTINNPSIVSPSFSTSFRYDGGGTASMSGNSTTISLTNTSNNNITVNSTDISIKSLNLKLTGTEVNVGTIDGITTNTINIGTVGVTTVNIGNASNGNLSIYSPKISSPTLSGTITLSSDLPAGASLTASTIYDTTDQNIKKIATNGTIASAISSVQASTDGTQVADDLTGLAGNSPLLARANHRHPIHTRLVDLIQSAPTDTFIVGNGSKWTLRTVAEVVGSINSSNGAFTVGVLKLGSAALSDSSAFAPFTHDHSTYQTIALRNRNYNNGTTVAIPSPAANVTLAPINNSITEFDCSLYDIFTITLTPTTSSSNTVTIPALQKGTLTNFINGDRKIIRITHSADGQRPLKFDSSYKQSNGAEIKTTYTAGSTSSTSYIKLGYYKYFEFQWNALSNAWDLINVSSTIT